MRLFKVSREATGGPLLRRERPKLPGHIGGKNEKSDDTCNRCQWLWRASAWPRARHSRLGMGSDSPPPPSRTGASTGSGSGGACSAGGLHPHADVVSLTSSHRVDRAERERRSPRPRSRSRQPSKGNFSTARMSQTRNWKCASSASSTTRLHGDSARESIQCLRRTFKW